MCLALLVNLALIGTNKQRVALENGIVCVSVKASEMQFYYVSAANLMVVK